MKAKMFAAAASLALLVWIGSRTPQPVRAQADDGVIQLRIGVGFTDTGSKPWQGKITVTAGQLTGIEGWRFSANDRTEKDGAFQFETKIGNLENQQRTAFPYGQTDWNDSNIRRLIPQGLIVRVRGEAPRIRFASPSGEFEFAAADVPLHRSLEVLGGNGRVERMANEQRLSEDGWADDEPAVGLGPQGERWVAWLSYQGQGDYVSVSDGTQPVRVTDKGDHNGPAIAVDPRGWVYVAYSAKEGDEYHLYLTTRALGRWTQARRMSAPGTSNLHPRLATDGKGRMALVWQALRDGQSVILLRQFDGRAWSEAKQLNEDKGNAWSPAAAFGGGNLWVAWDSYSTGAYQIYAREAAGAVERVTAGGSFSVRPSVAVSPEGTPVVAWEESDGLWGKDYAFLVDRRGTSIYKNRRVRVGYREGSQWKELPGDTAESVPAEMRRFVQQPQVAFDPAGRLLMAFRCRTSTSTARIDHWAAQGRWESFFTRWEGGRWAGAVPLPHSAGRNSMRVSIAASKEAAHVVWPTDGRPWQQVSYGDLDVYATRFTPAGEVHPLRGGKPIAAPPAEPASTHPNENQDVARIRNYRIAINGKTYRIVRGDVHRHTELSQDGAGDGSLEDLYRYTLDAAAMDYAHVADHQMGTGEEYNWWITQKSNDLYYMPRRFVPLYGYERSVRYPNGHRNVIWAERGKPVLPIAPAEQSGKVNTGSVLYPYLRKTDGIVTSHTSATEQGTDWRDHDAALEPFVEIYQGFESSYEHEGAPRAWKEGEKAVHQGVRKAGYVWNAWAKGYKMGVQASSDHVSTHTSYACVLVEELTRKGLVDAMRKRHTYAATDAIVMDFRINGTALMGDAVTSAAPPKLQVKVIGTSALERVDVIRNNTYVHKVNPAAAETSFEYVDAAAIPGESYYYVRARQNDGQLAWSSPIWVTYAR